MAVEETKLGMPMLLVPLVILALTACEASHRSESEMQLAGRVGTDHITLAEVDARVQVDDPEAWLTLYQARNRALEAIVEKRLLAMEAEREGVEIGALLAREIAARVMPVDDGDVAAFYEKNREQIGGHTLEDVRGQLRDYLIASAARQARASYVADLSALAGVEVLIELPRHQLVVGADEPAKGPVDAPVVIVEYSDFQCPFCRRTQTTLAQIAETYGDQVRHVFRDFPLAMHKDAHRAAQAAQCAHEQGAFWTYGEILFENMRLLGDEHLQRYAEKIGLDTVAFGECLTTDRYVEAIDADMASGQAYGVTGTPAFLINGRFLSGAQPLAAFRDIIDDELRRLGLGPP